MRSINDFPTGLPTAKGEWLYKDGDAISLSEICKLAEILGEL